MRQAPLTGPAAGPLIGILGGTFDPIHFGHLRPALDLLQRLPLREVRFLPCRLPPHREPPVAGPDHRLAMLELALAGEPGLRVDTRELEREGPSYMVDTLLDLRRELGGAQPLALILGMDAFRGLPTWHRWQEILGLCHLVVTRRPGWEGPLEGEAARLARTRAVEDPAALERRPAGSILFQAVTRLDISASRIRSLLAGGHSPRYLLPAAVLDYIQRHGLYRPERRASGETSGEPGAESSGEAGSGGWGGEASPPATRGGAGASRRAEGLRRAGP
ncbi:MAG: nicotinate-nucleotide adenylyltransferase [Gammaproteobacteria bacterium]|nr:MAG: nicotinate-nucleotide adenylyltransferase [Gammaproteobacteria bacterium]